METTIQAADANREFSRVLRDVKAGQSYVVTSHGRPVAKIVPILSAEDAAMVDARARLMARLASQPAIDVGRWSRDELHER